MKTRTTTNSKDVVVASFDDCRTDVKCARLLADATGSRVHVHQVRLFTTHRLALAYAQILAEKTGSHVLVRPAVDACVNPCPIIRKEREVTDRARRYRANQDGCRPAGPKKCELCGARSDLMIDHKNSNESDGRRSNLRWLCRSCNTRLGAKAAREGLGRRTAQYNPGARTLGEYIQAVTQHTRRAHDEAGRIIHETPKSRRREFAAEIWDRRRAHHESVPF
jgi:hypothetical protein